MQAVKDSFYMALRGRLAQANQARMLDDGTSPAILVCENTNDARLSVAGAFYLRWLGDGNVAPDAAARGWRSLRCEIAYRSQGSDVSCGEDRGRELAQLDSELSAMLSPPNASLKDYATDPESDLGALLLWTTPKFQDAKDGTTGLERTVLTEILWREDA